MMSLAATATSISRPKLPRAHAVLALARRDYLLTRSYRNTFLLELVFGVVNILVYYFISKTLGHANRRNLDGAPSYFDFAAVGAVVTVVIGATSTELATRVRQEQLTGTLEALFVQPLTSVEIALGLVAIPFVFAMVRAVFYLGIASLFLGLDVSRANWPVAALVLAVSGAVMAALGIAAGAFVLVVRRGNLLTGMALFAMGFVGGAVFPTAVLPAWLQPLGRIVPIRFAFHGLRSGLFGTGDWHTDAVVLAAFAAVGIPTTLWLFARAVAWCKQRATLAKY